MKRFRKFAATSLSAIALLSALPASAADLSSASAQSSRAVSMVSVAVVGGTVVAIADGSKFVITSVEELGDGVVYFLKDFSTNATLSIKTSARASQKGAEAASAAVGKTVTVVADASGHALIASGKVIAYIPNEIGKSLLHNKPSTERGA